MSPKSPLDRIFTSRITLLLSPFHCRIENSCLYPSDQLVQLSSQRTAACCRRQDHSKLKQSTGLLSVSNKHIKTIIVCYYIAGRNEVAQFLELYTITRIPLKACCCCCTDPKKCLFQRCWWRQSPHHPAFGTWTSLIPFLIAQGWCNSRVKIIWPRVRVLLKEHSMCSIYIECFKEYATSLQKWEWRYCQTFSKKDHYSLFRSVFLNMFYFISQGWYFISLMLSKDRAV